MTSLSERIELIEKAMEGELSRSENAFQPQPMEAPMRRDELKQKAIEQFTDYFVKNYPGPDTIIYDPKWHAPKIFAAAFRAITAALEVEQPVAVEIKLLEWSKTLDRYRGSERREQWVAKTPWGGLYIWHYQFDHDEVARGPKFTVGAHQTPFEPTGVEYDTLEAAKAAAQQDYETRIRSAIVEVPVEPVEIPPGLVERCAEILAWKSTGRLPGEALRTLGQKIADELGGSLFIDNGLGQAELRTVDEALRLILLLSTRIPASSAEAGGSATVSTGTGGGE
ncbi:hypothetical protein [Shinella sp.]|uniref:hypothetical protein n=1 Tax=Shinella sp. TaxID=1870904 RepID=UPI0029C041CC|nr:hypothetical protein [Shinella sp.]